MKTLNFFAYPILFTLLALGMLFLFDHSYLALYLALVLSLLEISLSFDNAVVNAKTLQTMSALWRKRFLSWGIIIAVFVMRLVFPIVLVYCTTALGFVDVIHAALYTPQVYQLALMQAHPLISAFGGAFLWSVFLEFLLAHERDLFWLPLLENNAAVRFMKRVPGAGTALTSLLGIGLAWGLHSFAIAVAFFIGLLLQWLLAALKQVFSDKSILKMGLSQGLIAFIYLEVLDASFSFDGVIGAFAISTDILVIMVGLGIGALFVRSFTLFLVERQSLKKYCFLDHGAHYAIGFLAIVMFVQLFIHVPEILPGSVSLVLLISAVIASKSSKTWQD